MAYFLVSYDLRQPGQQYQDLYKALESFPDWWHCLDSVWIIASDKRAADIAKYLSRFLDKNDQLVVVVVGQDWASLGLTKECSDWLRTRLG